MAVERASIDYIKKVVGDSTTTRESIINAYESHNRILQRIKQIRQEKNKEPEKKKEPRIYKLKDIIPETNRIEKIVLEDGDIER